MAAKKTLPFLPEVFQTENNKKFLTATIDQLTSEPDFRKVNGYIGRKFAPTYKSGDNYLIEPSAARQHYQLEPAVVVQDKAAGSVRLFASYQDLIQQIAYYGGLTDNHDRLFGNEAYNFDGLFDFDKFINFNNYYWMPTGPIAVQVYAGVVNTEATYTVTRNLAANGYTFVTNNTNKNTNPVITLARGGTYQFVVNQPGAQFWIQTEPGESGTKSHQSNIGTRDVFGVLNNGTETGTITFRVPLESAQERYTAMRLASAADYATTLSYTEVQNQLLSTFVAAGKNFDGATENLDNKTIIFINSDIDATLWTNPSSTNAPSGYDDGAGQVVPAATRRNVWKVRLIPIDSDNSDYVIKLESAAAVTLDQKVYVKSGYTQATKEFYVNYNNVYVEIPLITAPLSRLFYQDSSMPGLVGEIKLVDPNNHKIDVDADIIGKTSYVSPNGVEFTNGMLIEFDDSATPSTYFRTDYSDYTSWYLDAVRHGADLFTGESTSSTAYKNEISIGQWSIDSGYLYNKQFYVEGVGSAIELVDVDQLVTPERMYINGLSTPEYITIKRSSIDGNPWSRSNRWVHLDVINAAAKYNNVPAVPDQSMRASRPIIEFAKNLQLINHGAVAKSPIDILNFTETDAFSNIEGATTATLNGTVLTNGLRVVFANDADIRVRNKIFVVNLVTIGGITQIHLTASADAEVLAGNSVVVVGGDTAGTNYWFNGDSWIQGQSKTSVNQYPLFDVVDGNGSSFTDTSVYEATTFAGTKIFSYALGAGANDVVLGFPLKYRNFTTVGDIEFSNDFDNDTITYTSLGASTTKNINTGFVKEIVNLTSHNVRNVWTKVQRNTKQYQIISKTYSGKTNWFEIDVLPESSDVIPNIKVFVNNTFLKTSQYSIKSIGVKKAVVISTSLLTVNDKIDILIYSKDVSQLGYYEIPKNLDGNPLNAIFPSLTLGQLRNHVSTIEQNTKIVADTNGIFTSLRDITYKNNPGLIVQHSAPVIYSNLFLQDETLNFVKGIELAAREYLKFKNKFLELAMTLSTVTVDDIPGSVDAIIKNINAIKNSSFAWYYSDMVPYGDSKTTTKFTVNNPTLKQYEISSVFDDAQLSSRAILVYLNGKQLTKGVEYYFPQDRSAVILTSEVTLAAEDTISIVEYANTDGSYVPETPSKLGLYPKFVPGMYLDDTYLTPANVIAGHDGSLTPAFGDYRDDLLLELEQRIYNNIKINYEKNNFDIYNYLPGKFRSTEYSRTEFNQVLNKSFLKWSGFNRVDFSTNTFFESNNPWTWNYKKFKDVIDGEFLPGSWRAIYQYWFDTDRPHTHPWEMLGFSEEPSWWQDRYGAAPYTGGNILLWTDLSEGYIHAGDRAGYDKRFARSSLLSIIPVDEYGALRSPDNFAPINFNSLDANTSFSVGDVGPVENAWRRSSDFPYAMQKALALTKPGFYFGSLINVENYYRDTLVDQLISVTTAQRISPDIIKINGDARTDTVVRTAGYLNWIRDYIQNLGIDPTALIASYLTNLNVQLSYKVAGFTDQKYIKVLAEQSSPTSVNDSIIIPDENYSVHLTKSAPIKKVVYSGVIIEKSENGYTVSGYDLANPYFTIVPSLTTGESYQISVINEKAVIFTDYQLRKVVVPYGFEFANKQQVVDFLVSYGRFLVSQGFRFDNYDSNLQDTRDWVLSSKEFLTWSQQGWKPGSIIVLSPVYDSLSFVTTSGVVDFVSNTTNGPKVLDQNFTIIKSNQFSVNREDNTFALNIIDTRTICLAELDVVQYEHVLVFDNTTVFNDIIYKPEIGNRQYRLKVIGSKTGSWTGNLNPPGFVYNDATVDEWTIGVDYKKGSIVSFKEQYYIALNDLIASTSFRPTDWKVIDKLSVKTGLLPNFSYNAQKFENIYDVDNSLADEDLNSYSTGLIGFRGRNYLDDFGLDQTSQVKFYQGYIKEKGTLNAVNGLTVAAFNNVTSNIDIFEEWALRVGEYGAIDSDQVLEVVLEEGVYTSDPAGIVLLNSGTSTDQNIIGVTQSDLYRAPGTFKTNIFYNRDNSSEYFNDIPTAGYVNVNDIDATLYDFMSYENLDAILPVMGKSYKIWVAKDFNNDWNVYRVSETKNNVVELSYNIDNVMTVTFEQYHSLTKNQVFAFKNFDSRFDGFYQVADVLDLSSVTVRMHKNSAELQAAASVTGYSPFFVLEPTRLSTTTDLIDITPHHGWVAGDRIWVDRYNAAGQWASFEKTEPWEFATQVSAPVAQYVSNLYFGSTAKVSSNGNIVVVGSPGSGTVAGGDFVDGMVKFFNKDAAGNFSQAVSISPNTMLASEFGASMDMSLNTVVVGAPGSRNNQGYAFVYNISNGASPSVAQILVDAFDGKTNDRFANSVTISGDSNWIFVGSPGENCVYSYRLTTATSASTPISADGIASSFALSFTPSETTSITVSSASKNYIPNFEYKVIGNTITFYNGDGVTVAAPAAGTITVKQASYYKFAQKLTPSANGTDLVGSSVMTNQKGTVVYVGAPGTNSSTGAVYIYSQRCESFKATGSVSFTAYSTPHTTRSTVWVNDIEQSKTAYTISGSVITFTVAPAAGSIVKVSNGAMDLTETIVGTSANARFGSTLDTTDTGCSVFVGAPQYASTNLYQRGVVYRYVDLASTTGKITSAAPVTGVTAGNGVYINGFHVTFTGTTIESVVANINNANIPGVTATNASGYLTITSGYKSDYLKLYVRYDGTAGIAQLNMQTPFSLAQTIVPPQDYVGQNFGYSLALDESGEVLLVGSERASTFKYTTIDNGVTIVDVDATRLVDETRLSGAVYMYELVKDYGTFVNNSGTMIYAQQISASNIRTGDKFGSAVAINSNTIVVGSPNNDTFATDGGIAQIFVNNTGLKTWAMTSSQVDRVDVESVNRLFIYNRATNLIIHELDYIDPAKGKVLGVAEQEIDFKSTADPAVYNSSYIANNVNPGYHWNEQQVGSIWWNLDSVRYVEYEQGDLSYRMKHWGSMFPGSEIEMYEWVESPVLPNQYVTTYKDGVPLYPDNSAYVAIPVVDVNGVIKTKYYFWVKNRRNSVAKGKTRSTATIADLIKNPHLQGIPYAALLRTDSIGLYGITDHITASDVVLHVDYANVKNTNSIHTEFELISENNVRSIIPPRIINKLVDSLSGLAPITNSNTGEVTDWVAVPDPSLSAVDKIGILIRPRQSMFIDRTAALKNMISYLNKVFAQYPIVNQCNITGLYAQEAEPSSTNWVKSVNTIDELRYIDTNELLINDRVLVKVDSTQSNCWSVYYLNSGNEFVLDYKQSYKTDLYWTKTNWALSGYDVTSKANYVVDSMNDVLKLSLTAGQTVKVNYYQQNQFAVLRVAADGSLETVVLENGTIKLLDTILDTNAELNPGLEIREILATIRDYIFVGALSDQFNKWFFVMVNYILSEQKSVDWIFKTSFISVVHQLRKLEQFPSYIKDSQDYYQSYINEVKPYRTQIREYLLDYSGSDNFRGDVTDFDLPSYYDTVTGTYRSPNGERASDSTTLTSGVYSQWNQHHSYQVAEVLVDPASAGTGFTVAPDILISGGGGSGAEAVATIDYVTGAITSIVVTNPGQGYTSTPSVVINGNGIGAKAAVRMTNNKVRQFDSVIKFDRITYQSNVVSWASNTSFAANTIVSYNNDAYIATANVSAVLHFDYNKFTKLSGNDVGTAVDRIEAYYNPGPGLPGKNIPQLIGGIEYPGVLVDGLPFSANVEFAANAALIDSYIRGNYADAALGTRPEDINVDGGKYVDIYSSHAPEELVPGIVFDSLNMTVFTRPIFSANGAVNTAGSTVGYRMFSDMAHNVNFYRIDASSVTTLAANLNVLDSTICVTDASVLPNPNPDLNMPGVVFINGEKITYYTRDTVNNVLGRIRRAVDGTGAPSVHLLGSRVVDSSATQLLTGDTANVWLQPYGTYGNVTSGNTSALLSSNASQVKFLIEKPSYNP